jgi:hypothetical protein
MSPEFWASVSIAFVAGLWALVGVVFRSGQKMGAMQGALDANTAASKSLENEIEKIATETTKEFRRIHARIDGIAERQAALEGEFKGGSREWDVRDRKGD